MMLLVGVLLSGALGGVDLRIRNLLSLRNFNMRHTRCRCNNRRGHRYPQSSSLDTSSTHGQPRNDSKRVHSDSSNRNECRYKQERNGNKIESWSRFRGLRFRYERTIIWMYKNKSSQVPHPSSYPISNLVRSPCHCGHSLLLHPENSRVDRGYQGPGTCCARLGFKDLPLTSHSLTWHFANRVMAFCKSLRRALLSLDGLLLWQNVAVHRPHVCRCWDVSNVISNAHLS